MVDGLHFDSIHVEDNTLLKRWFDKGEVVQVVNDLQADKASSPDGFIMALVQKCWPVIEEDIMVFFF